MNSSRAVAAPQTVADIEQLVIRMYRPGNAHMIAQIDDQLKQLQLSEGGWQMADELLHSSDQNVRFYACLTFIVKLNNDGPMLSEQEASAVLSKLVTWLVCRVRGGEEILILKKLCSALTTYLVRSPLPWQYPIQQIVLSFRDDGIVDNDADVSLFEVLPSLEAAQIMALLWFSSSLAEDAGKIDSNTPAHARLHAGMEAIVSDASTVMAHALNQTSDKDLRLRQEALDTFASWTDYAQPLWPSKPESLQCLRDLVPAAAQCLLHPHLQDHTLDIFRDMLESYTSFFQPPHMDLLASIITTQIRPALEHRLEDQDPEALSYGQFVIAFGSANVQQVVEQPENINGSKAIIQLHFDILQAPGYPGGDDELSALSIEFWNTYVEYVNDTLFSRDTSDPEPPWLDMSRSVLKAVIQLFWVKMCTPLSDVAVNWAEEEREAFKEFRVDATDLMQSIFLLLGPSMLEQYVSCALQSLEVGQWRGVEAALFCLNALAESVSEDEASENIVKRVFESNLFRDIRDMSQPIPFQARRTAIDMVGSYSHYIERHAEFIEHIVLFLFTALETEQLANTAARSISTLCSTCRISLTKYLTDFLQQYQLFLGSPTCDTYTKEKIIGAIASIVQALTPESARVEPLLQLLSYVEVDIQVANSSAEAGDFEAAELSGVTALTCLASIGKGMQTMADLPITLYDDDDVQVDVKSKFWEAGDGKVVQDRIMACFSTLQIIGHSSDAVEAACQVLKTGFVEVEAGPFVLPPSITVSFLQHCTLQTPQLEAVIDTACTLITQRSRSGSDQIDAEVLAICNQIATFMQQVRVPSEDPSVAQSCIEVLCRTLPHYTHIILDPSLPLQRILEFTLRAIDGQEVFPKRSATEFWSKLIKAGADNIADDVRIGVQDIINVYGSTLSRILIRHIGGVGQRSELDYLCEPLKALITLHPRSKQWLEAALFSDSFPPVQPVVNETSKRMFLQQLMSLRGDGRKTKEVVKRFYAECRGTVSSYGS